ncbi:LacI family DNA-binding transcriptional regulator [Clostridium algoriphilum]|uniref:LacI family DNA-binding transcriptional regulator n=1 Tax=Clostridium algoriphilum TaxID=198347 RepID=UPI001CF5D3C2|nr:LacI family DNA-binding transcriptional regulator [Clostridium algoriphilum]MCB2294405.1 LacI family DNA-binding transcriptional regulator [Clostridium algoriphilum]
MNIIEFSKMVGVSKSTVSRYFNNGYVSEVAIKKIKLAIEKTGFQPQRQAQSLRTKKTNLIGVIIPKISTETAPRVVEGIADELNVHGYDILIANTNLNTEKEIEYLKIFKNNQVDGIIFMATKITNEHLKVMQEVKVPIVVVAQNLEEYPSVYNDDYNASRDVVRYIISKGHKDIGFIGVYEEDISVGQERKKGYIDELRENNIEINEEFIKIGNFKVESGYTLAKELMNQKEKPTAIFAVTDNIAIGIIEYLSENGYNIPNDVAIIGMGDSKISSFTSPKLTTVHFYYKTSGVVAANMMVDLLTNRVGSSKNILMKKKLPYKLVERSSM